MFALRLLLGLCLLPVVTHGCDAGVYYGQNCTSAKAAAGDTAACNAWPLGANATDVGPSSGSQMATTSTTLPEPSTKRNPVNCSNNRLG